MGRNGRLWALTSTKVYQYHEKKKSFKIYKKSDFNKKEQEFLKLPVGVTVSSIISDRDDKLWIIKKNSKTLYWQKKRKGKYTSTNLPPFAQNITDITIDIIGNVYVAAGEIYKWNYKRKKFDRIYKRGGPFIRVSSGPPGTLWAVNDKSQIFEFVSGRLEKRPLKGKFKGQDIDISVDGTIYATSKTHETAANEPGPGRLANPASQRLCYLRKYNPLRGGFEKTGRKSEHYAQFVAVASDGTPWMTCAPGGSNKVYRGD
jgi:hypothetical protein